MPSVKNQHNTDMWNHDQSPEMLIGYAASVFLSTLLSRISTVTRQLWAVFDLSKSSGGGSSAEGARIEAPKAPRVGPEAAAVTAVDCLSRKPRRSKFQASPALAE